MLDASYYIEPHPHVPSSAKHANKAPGFAGYAGTLCPMMVSPAVRDFIVNARGAQQESASGKYPEGK